MLSRQDYVYMSRALRLARNGIYTTDPNPNVGCVLVKNGRIIGEGWHAKAGCRHAETEAIQQADKNELRGATAYVTLEPCSHHGKTPPCCDALIRAGIARVVTAMEDPNPLVAGNGLRRLQAAGITVECGVLENDALNINRGYIKRMQTGRPLVISKMAMGLDGRTAAASGESQWITSAESRADVHRLRAQSSAILTGINTVLADDCSLTARLNKDVEILQPVRVVLDSGLRMPSSAKMASLAGRTMILTCSDDAQKIRQRQHAGLEVHRLPAVGNRLDLESVVRFLGEHQVNQLLIEAGPTLNGAFLNTGLVDEWVIYMAPAIIGDGGRSLFALPGLKTMADKIELKIKEVRSVGADLKITLIGK